VSSQCVSYFHQSWFRFVSSEKKTFKKFCVIVIVAIFLGDGCGVNYIITGIMHMNALHFSEKKTYSVLDGSVL